MDITVYNQYFGVVICLSLSLNTFHLTSEGLPKPIFSGDANLTA